jgi:hypothetical protein
MTPMTSGSPLCCGIEGVALLRLVTTLTPTASVTG